MEPKEQIKTIMEIFAGLEHGDQVSLFQTVKSALLEMRAELISKHQKDHALASENIDRLRAGNEEIHGALGAQVAKQGY